MTKLSLEYIPISEIVPYKNNPRKNEKAVEVVADSIKQFGFKNPIILDKNNESVLDLFGGSGSTLIACEQLNRKCFMMELDPVYCSVIIERWEKLTGKKAEKLQKATN